MSRREKLRWAVLLTIANIFGSHNYSPLGERFSWIKGAVVDVTWRFCEMYLFSTFSLFGDDLSPGWGEHSRRIKFRSEGDIFYLKHRLGTWLTFSFPIPSRYFKTPLRNDKIYYILWIMLLNSLTHISFGREIQIMPDLLMPNMFITALITFINVYYGEDLEQTFEFVGRIHENGPTTIPFLRKRQVTSKCISFWNLIHLEWILPMRLEICVSASTSCPPCSCVRWSCIL